MPRKLLCKVTTLNTLKFAVLGRFTLHNLHNDITCQSLTAQNIILEAHRVQKKPLTELIKEIEQEMLRLGYTESSMKFYRRRWQRLLQFAQERGEIYFSEQLGIDYLEKHFHILEKDFERTLSQAETQELRIIRVIGDFQLHHTILRRYYKHREILKKPCFMEVSNQFRKSCIEKGYSPVTIDHYVK